MALEGVAWGRSGTRKGNEPRGRGRDLPAVGLAEGHSWVLSGWEAGYCVIGVVSGRTGRGCGDPRCGGRR